MLSDDIGDVEPLRDQLARRALRHPVKSGAVAKYLATGVIRGHAAGHPGEPVARGPPHERGAVHEATLIHELRAVSGHRLHCGHALLLHHGFIHGAANDVLTLVHLRFRHRPIDDVLLLPHLSFLHPGDLVVGLLAELRFMHRLEGVKLFFSSGGFDNRTGHAACADALLGFIDRLGRRDLALLDLRLVFHPVLRDRHVVVDDLVHHAVGGLAEAILGAQRCGRRKNDGRHGQGRCG